MRMGDRVDKSFIVSPHHSIFRYLLHQSKELLRLDLPVFGNHPEEGLQHLVQDRFKLLPLLWRALLLQERFNARLAATYPHDLGLHPDSVEHVTVVARLHGKSVELDTGLWGCEDGVGDRSQKVGALIQPDIICTGVDELAALLLEQLQVVVCGLQIDRKSVVWGR